MGRKQICDWKIDLNLRSVDKTRAETMVYAVILLFQSSTVVALVSKHGFAEKEHSKAAAREIMI